MNRNVTFRLPKTFRRAEQVFQVSLESKNVDAHSSMTDFSPALNRLLDEALEAAARHIEYLIKQEDFVADHNRPR